MGVSVDVSANVAPFKQGMNDAAASVRTFDAALKKNEQELKSTGNAEQYMTQKASLLRGQISAQQAVVANAQKALKAMTDNGVNPSSAAYQNLAAKAIGAETSLGNMEDELRQVEAGAKGAGEKVGDLSTTVAGIGKKVSLDVLIRGINSVTNGLENAARRALKFGKEVVNAVKDAAEYADDLNTRATMYNMTPAELQQAEYAARFLDVQVDSIVKTREKLLKNTSSKESADFFAMLGINLGGASGKGGEISELRDLNSIFWQTGEAIMNIGNYADQEEAAMKTFGMSWDSIRPLFAMTAQDIEKYGTARKRYEQISSEAPLVGDDDLNKLQALQDSFDALDAQFTVMKETVLAQLAPAFTQIATGLSDMLKEFNEFAKTPEGQEALQGVADAFSSIFTDLSNVNFGETLEAVKSGITGVRDAMQWIASNKDAVVTGLKAVFIGWGALKLTGGALQLVQLINGIKLLSSGGAAAAGAAAGASWGAAFVNAITAAAPWLIGFMALVAPAHTAGNELDTMMHEDGSPTAAGWDYLNGGELDRRFAEISKRYKDLSEFADSPDFLSAVTNLNYSDDNEMFSALENLFELHPVGLPAEVDPDMESLQNEMNSKRVIIPATVVADDVQMSVRVPGASSLPGHANGLSFVPYDGYLAYLHRGERVLTAAANRSYTANSNLYVGSMYMNNGMDAAALMETMNSQTRMTMSGFGSR